MTGLLLRLAGPLQSWGEHSTFADRDTLRYPTRSGITGIFAAAQGLRRGEPLDRYAPLTLTVRIDRPGVLLADFHTTGGGLPRGRTVPTAEGGRRAEGKATIVTRRMYLSDAVFTVAVEGPGQLIGDLAAALRSPRWQPYLGRRSCPPDQPLLLRAAGRPGPGALPARAAARASGPTSTARSARTSSPRNRPAPAGTLTEVADVPVTFSRHDRRYQLRTIRRERAALPGALARWRSSKEYHRALAEYARRPS